MKKNGFTTIELIICFIIVSVISISIFGVVLNFRERQQIESLRSEVLAFKYSLTKTIQDDIIKKGVKDVRHFDLGNQLNIDYIMGETGGIKTYLLYAHYNELTGIYSIVYGSAFDGNFIYYELPKIEDLEIDMDRYYTSVDQIGTSNTYIVTIYIPFVHPDLDEDYGIDIVFPFTKA